MLFLAIKGGFRLKKLGLALAATLFVSSFSASPSSAAGFPDVSDTNRFHKEIQYLSDEGVITGFTDGKFQPKAGVTRGQAAIMLGKALGYSAEKQNTPFKDVDASIVSSGYIEKLVKEGIISGYPDGTFKPAKTVTRAEMAIFISRAFDWDYEGEPEYFFDVQKGMKAYHAIQKLSAWGVAAGYEQSMFRPAETLTREQFAAFTARAMNLNEFGVGPDEVEVAFLDVGQGDATYVEYADGRAVLIDAGPNAEQISRALKEIGARPIDALILTHPDPEHMGGAAWVIENYGVQKVYESGLPIDPVVFKDYENAIQQNNVAVKTAKTGDNLSLDASVAIQVLHADPKAETADDGGMVLKMTSDLWDFLLAGDATPEVQQHLVDKYDLKADVLQVPHHGEETYYTYPLIDEVKARMAILSYSGKPDDSVVNDLRASGSDIYDTHNQGNVIYVITDEFMRMNVNRYLFGYGQLVPDIRIVKKDLKAEVVTLTNYDRVNADMTGFTLVSVKGNETFKFPDGFILRSGQSVDITSGPNAVHQPPKSLKWTNAEVWDDRGDAAKLFEFPSSMLDEMP
ncbi:Cellulosome-anchoring protein precursor [Planococcus massiliensis]|uniref:Cellulosome-anchoring protein n=1 Tax=Planococcus massiliensis TaxID=1499687 RepID=A0A098ENR3_9BACL|nr:Cellulosome-anchoring protein precursor [Planococcus massiliensis]